MTQRWGRSRDSRSRDSLFLSHDIGPSVSLRGGFGGQKAENESLRQPADIARARAAFETGHRRADRVEPVEHTTLALLRTRLRINHNSTHGAGDAGAER